jgi:hypothetical protein
VNFKIAPLNRQQIVAVKEYGKIPIGLVLFPEQEVRLIDAVDRAICRHLVAGANDVREGAIEIQHADNFITLAARLYAARPANDARGADSAFPGAGKFQTERPAVALRSINDARSFQFLGAVVAGPNDNRIVLNACILALDPIYEGRQGGPSREVGQYTYAKRPWVDEMITNKATAYINAHGKDQKPFFLYVPFSNSHSPPIPNPKFADHDHTNYQNALREIDANTG